MNILVSKLALRKGNEDERICFLLLFFVSTSKHALKCKG